jgi:hypothetical protein
MLLWYKRAAVDNLPTKKQDQLARYYETCHQGDLEALLLSLLPLATHNEFQHDNGDNLEYGVNALEVTPLPSIPIAVYNTLLLDNGENGDPLNVPNNDCDDDNASVLDSGCEQHSHDERELAILLAAGFCQDLEGITEV